jgi:chromosome partitioning protein
MIILLASQKGGAGKSTIAVNIASYLKDVLIVDADRQASLLISDFADKFKIVSCYNDITKQIKTYKQKYKNIVIDVAGRDSNELRSALLVANIVIIPFIPSQPDLATLDNLNDIIQGAKKHNKQIKLYAVINNASVHHKDKLAKEAKEFIKENSKIKILDTVLRTRNSYRDMFIKNKSIFELKDKKAKAEVNQMIKELKL